VKKPNPIPNSKPWNPGQAPYAEWLKALTPEQKEAHLRQRREKKSMKRAMAAVVEQYQSRWVAELHNAAWAQLVRARESGDTQAFVAVWDRIVGRPQENDQTDTERPLPWSDQDI
jgi:cell division inhibitor SulA